MHATENRKYLYWFLIALLIALLPWFVLAQDTSVKKQKYNLNKEIEDEIGYAQAVRVWRTLYISGSVGAGSMDKAVKDVYDELSKTLAAYHATFKNVVKENAFTTDLEAFKKHIELRKSYYKGDYPAATWVQVQQLYLPELVLEIELVAEL